MKKTFKIISLALSVLMILQPTVWPLSQSSALNLLQPRLIFSASTTESDFFQMISGYLVFYLADIENNPDLTNIPRLKSVIDEKLAVLRVLDNISPVFRKKLPVNSFYEPETASIMIDLGENKIRYFDHNVSGSDLPRGIKESEEYIVKEKKVGRYLTRQVISRKASCAAELHSLKREQDTSISSGKGLFKELKHSGKKLFDVVKNFIPASSKRESEVLTGDRAVIRGKGIAPEIRRKVTEIVDHYSDERNITAAETRYTSRGHLYAPSSSEVVIKVAEQFIERRDTHVLDLGYGAGKAAAIFSLFSKHVTGVEIDSMGTESGKSTRLAEAGIGHIDKLAEAGLVNKDDISLIKGDFLSDEFDMSDFDLVYIYWPYKTEESAEYAFRLVEKLTDPEKGLKKNAVFTVNAPSREALRVFFPVLKEVDIKYSDWKELKTLGRLLFAFKIPEEKVTGGGESEKPYGSDKARALLRKWKALPGISNATLIDVYYAEDSLKVPIEETGYTPQGAIYSQSDISDLVAIGEMFLSGKNVKVLDAGSGAGKAAAVFSCYARHVTGVEIDSMSRSGGGEKRLFEVGKDRIEFLADEGIVDRGRIELTDEDIFDPDLDLSEYDVVYHYWSFCNVDPGKYIEKFTRKLLDTRKGLKPGGLFILNSLVKEVNFPDLERVNISVGKNITVYRRSLKEKGKGFQPPEIQELSFLPGELVGAVIQGRKNSMFEIVQGRKKNVMELIDKEGRRAAEVKLSFPGGTNGAQIRIEEFNVFPGFEGMNIESGFMALMRGKVPEGYLLAKTIKEEETIKYLEKLYDNGEGLNEQEIVKKYEPSVSGIGRMYMENGFGMQVVRLRKGAGDREYELIAFRSDEPYDHRKAMNLLIKLQFGKWGEKEAHLSWGSDGRVYSVRSSLLADPGERRLVNNVYADIVKDLPQGSSVLSVGVGTGPVAGMLAESGYNVTGVDITPEILKIAARKGIRTIEADAGDRSFWEREDHSMKYETIIFSESLEYFEDPENIFSMAKTVLSRKGRIYILARDIPGNRREEIYEKALKKAGFSIKSGAGHLFFGNNAGLRIVSGEKIPDNAPDKEKIIEKVKEIIPRLIHHMMFFASPVAGERENGVGRPAEAKAEKVILLIDKELSTMNKNTDVIRNTKRLINILAGIKGNNTEIAGFLENLEILPVEGSNIGQGRRFKDRHNIIAVTKTSNKELFEKINSEVFVAAIKEEDFPDGAYLPLLEVILFAIGKYLDLDSRVLKQYYENIPQAKSLEELAESGELSDIFDPAVRSFVIQLPHARNFEVSEDLVETMEIIRDLLQKA